MCVCVYVGEKGVCVCVCVCVCRRERSVCVCVYVGKKGECVCVCVCWKCEIVCNGCIRACMCAGPCINIRVRERGRERRGGGERAE